MKLYFIIFAVSSVVNVFPASQFKVSPKNKSVAYSNVYIEAKNRTIHIFEIERPHILEEVSRLNTKLPIRSIEIYSMALIVYLRVHCRLGSVSNVCIYQIKNPTLPFRVS